jgi:hypothetical protein
MQIIANKNLDYTFETCIKINLNDKKISLAKDFYEYYVFHDKSKTLDLLSCSTISELNDLFTSDRSSWATRKNKTNQTSFIECLYILSKHYKLCSVLSNKRIMWKRVNFKQGKFSKNPIDREFVSLLIDYQDVKFSK